MPIYPGTTLYFYKYTINFFYIKRGYAILAVIVRVVGVLGSNTISLKQNLKSLLTSSRVWISGTLLNEKRESGGLFGSLYGTQLKNHVV